MTKSRKYSIIAALFLAVPVIYNFVSLGADFSSFMRIIFYMYVFGFPITLFINNKISVCVISGIYVFYYAYYTFKVPGFNNITNLIPGFINFFTVLMSINKKEITKKIWFLSGILLLLHYIIYWILIKDTFIAYWQYWLSDCLFTLFNELCRCVGFLFIGLWAKENVCDTNGTQLDNHTSSNSKTIEEKSSNYETIEKLKKYKELLDSNIITQKEFDTKKKELLG